MGAKHIDMPVFASQPVYLGRLLIVDDDESVRNLFVAYFEKIGFHADAVPGLSLMRQKLAEGSYDGVLVDLMLEGEDGLEAIPLIMREYPRTKVFIMSNHGTIEVAVDAMERGASAFIAKSKNPVEVAGEIRRRLAHTEVREGAGDSNSNVQGRCGMIGSSPAIMALCGRIEMFGAVDSTVLITGESGTGKELVARAIHSLSDRAKRRFEAINCAAIPGTLLESELFGHKRGAFTDAKADRRGIFERCEDGVIFLDEIGEMPLSLQVKLLRVLQEKEITPIGGSEVIKVNARIITATNRNPWEEVKQGRMREDLFYRLAVLTIDVPPLRERRSDIPELARHFTKMFANKFAKPIRPLSHETEARLMAHNWPGNVRELQNAIERAVVLSRAGDLQVEDLFPVIEHPVGIAAGGAKINAERSLSEAKAEFLTAYLRQLLQATRGNISEMARISGRYRADIYKLLAKHGLEWEEFRT